MAKQAETQTVRCRSSCGRSPSASSRTWGRRAAWLAGGVLPRESPLLEESWEDPQTRRYSPPRFWRNTNLNLNLRPRAVFFFSQFLFLYIWYTTVLAQRDSKPRPRAQEMEWGAELWHGPEGDAHGFLMVFKATSANLTEKGDLEVQKGKELGREFFSSMGKVDLQLH